MAVILVTDAEQRAALAVVRSLGRAGHVVHVTARSNTPLAGASRWCSSVTVVPDPMRDADANISAHREVIRRLKVDVLIPVAEATALALLDAPLGDVHIPMPSADVFRRVCDKAAVLEAAGQVGLRVPEQIVLQSRAQCEAMRIDRSLERVRLPAIIKPSRSVAGPGGKMLKLPVSYVEDTNDIVKIVGDIPDNAFPLLLQERVQGSGLGVFHLMWDGHEVANFAHRRLREKPPSGGVSTLREAIALPSDLHARSLALLHAIGMTHGVAMVEFKAEDNADPVLMEINGRFWGSLQLAIDAGVDFPAILVQCALGAAPGAPQPYRAGVQSRWFWGDVDHAIARVRRGVDVHGHAAYESTWQVVRDVFLRSSSQQRDELWQRDDRAPFWRETWNWLRRR